MIVKLKIGIVDATLGDVQRLHNIIHKEFADRFIPLEPC